MGLLQSIIDKKSVEAIARKWKIKELAVFGSVLGDNFNEESDVDILIQFESETRYNLFDFVDLKDELEGIFGRSVDLVEKSGIRNPFLRKEILQTARTIYAA